MKALGVACALAAGVLAAQSGNATPPDLGAPEGAERTAHRDRPYDRYEFPTGVFGRQAAMAETLSGAVTWQAFRLDDPSASTEGVMASYRARLDSMGFEPVFACHSRECGGFDFRFRAAILPAPAMLLDVADFAQYSARLVAPDIYASILVSRVHDALYVQTVRVVPAAAPIEVTASPALEAQTEVSLMPAAERALLDVLLSDGHVQVEGLAFQQGGALLSGSSAESLDLLARLLTRDGELAVYIVGHSDTDGGLDLNLDLSRRRAEAVRAALIERGVPEQQVAARGIAFLAPLTSNATPEGRARNRRVELVLRPQP